VGWGSERPSSPAGLAVSMLIEETPEEHANDGTWLLFIDTFIPPIIDTRA
jgi:hypothetical protein